MGRTRPSSLPSSPSSRPQLPTICGPLQGGRLDLHRQGTRRRASAHAQCPVQSGYPSSWSHGCILQNQGPGQPWDHQHSRQHKYCTTFKEVLELQNMEPSDVALKNFKEKLVTFRDRHKCTTLEIGLACKAMKEKRKNHFKGRY